MGQNVDLREVADALRDLLNWVAVYETEYDLPLEVSSGLREHIEYVADALEELPAPGFDKQMLLEEYEEFRASREREELTH